VDLAVVTMANAIEHPEVEPMMHFEQGQVEVLKLPVPSVVMWWDVVLPHSLKILASRQAH
jgi:Trk K+ transport system NAD-binding subunit